MKLFYAKLKEDSVHPHTRGDNQFIFNHYSPNLGTPPHAWGQLLVGIWGFLGFAVHPHTRGDNINRELYLSPYSGTPPHAWGQFSNSFSHFLLHRYTPTRVGTMKNSFIEQFDTTVHPHTRGDNFWFSEFCGTWGGTPPHAWGQLPAGSVFWTTIRYTPTRVGTMLHRFWHTYPTPVHPHTRGDNYFVVKYLNQPHGTPPHAWGQFVWYSPWFNLCRYTPTRVGTITFPSKIGSFTTVHPHTRGDNSSSQGRFWYCIGTPPHAWGQFKRFWHSHWRLRYTPTRVGTISFDLLLVSSNAVHPHTRGDNISSGMAIFI